MANKTPWMTSTDLINSVKRKIAVPTSQVTFSDQDILDFANEEMMIAQVPAIMTYHEEYFVKAIEVPIQQNVDRYPIPNRAIALKLRDLAYKDDNGTLYEMTRVNSEDKAYWQRTFGIGGVAHRFYIEGNDIVITPNPSNIVNGSLVFYIFFRPNQLVANNRSCTIQSFKRSITLGSLVDGDELSINSIPYEAVSGSPTSTQFQIGGTPTISATNLAATLNSNGIIATSLGATVTVQFNAMTTTFATNNTSTVTINSNIEIVCNQLPSTYIDPVTGLSSSLYTVGENIDFLQTNPGHQTRKYDVTIPTGGISGTSFILNISQIPSDLIAKDYICLANECIIPQIPSDLHNGLAERTAARILASLGDSAGLQASLGKIQEITMGESKLLNDRVDGSPQKVLARHSFLRYNKRSGFRRY